jgi:hypothetical protein
MLAHYDSLVAHIKVKMDLHQELLHKATKYPNLVASLKAINK